MGRCRVQKSRNREYSAIISLSSLHTFLVDFLPRVFLRIVILLNTKYCKHTGFPGGSDSKESACNAGDPGLMSGWEGSLEKGILPLQYQHISSCLCPDTWHFLLPCPSSIPNGPSASAFILHALFSDRRVLLKYVVRSCCCSAQNSATRKLHFSQDKSQILSLPLLSPMSVLAIR